MKTYYAWFVRGQSYATTYKGFPLRGFAGLGDSLSVEAEDVVEAFLKIYRRLSEEGVEITAVKVDGQDFILGFSADEWHEIAKTNVRIEEAVVPRNGGIQIQAISDVPFV